MRFGLDATKVLPPRDGIGNYSTQLIQALMQIPCDHEFWLYGLTHPAQHAQFLRDFPDCPPHFRLRTTPDPRPHEVQLYHSLTHGFPPAYRGHSVFTCHDLTVLTHAQFHTVENKVNCLLGVLRALYRGTHFLAISQATAQDLKQHLGVPAERITRVYSGTASHFRPLPEGQAAARVAERFGLTRPFVLSVGTLEPRKNLRRLLEAYAGLPPELRQEFPLVICGGAGWKHEETAAYLARQPELSGVRQLGRVADADLVALYGAAAVFAFPSLAEGFGLPVVEAMACGTPVVTANLSALPEIAGAGGLLVDPYDVAAIRQALRLLLNEPAERQRLGRLALDQAAKFSWTQTARETLALYERVAASAG